MANFYHASKRNPLNNKVIDIKITRLSDQGVGVGQYQKKPVFVEGALPDEVIKAKVVEQKSKFIKAKLTEIISLSEHRVLPKCQHYYRCGGCDLQHLNENQHLAFKQEKVSQLLSRAGFKDQVNWLPAITSSSYGYRRKARIGVQYNKQGRPIIGFRQKSAKHLTEINACPVLVPELEHIFPKIKAIVEALSAHKSVGHIEVIQTDVTTLVVRQLVTLGDADKGLWLKAEKSHHWQVMIDDGHIIQPLQTAEPLHYLLKDNTDIEFSADDFIQVNHHVNQQMVQQALNWLELTREDIVLDLFCGLGNFSLPMAKLCANVVGVEGVQAMVDKALHNAAINQVSNCQFYQADLNSCWQDNAWAKVQYSKVLLDPARAGAEYASHEIVKLDPKQILYVSCEPASLARDSQVFLQAGYQIQKIALMEMFSHTKHVETMVLFHKI